MNGRIAVLIPTRDRPGQFLIAAESVRATSTLADVIAYVDDDQVDAYKGRATKGSYWVHGPRIGPVASANALWKSYPDYSAYGLITDDSIITTIGWDQWLLAAFGQLPLAVISPHHGNGNYVDMPFVSKTWTELVGWYACPLMKHYAWPIVSGLIGEMSSIVHAPAQSFHIQHTYDPMANPDRSGDYEAFFSYVSRDLPGTVDLLRKAMYA